MLPISPAHQRTAASPAAGRERQAMDALREVGLAEVGTGRCARSLGGEQQRLALAAAWALPSGGACFSTSLRRTSIPARRAK